MSWFCKTCDHTFDTQGDPDRQCRACVAEEKVAELELVTAKLAAENNDLFAELHGEATPRDWDRNADGEISDFDELAAYTAGLGDEV